MENHEEEEKKEEEGKQLSCAVSAISCDVANLGVIFVSSGEEAEEDFVSNWTLSVDSFD